MKSRLKEWHDRVHFPRAAKASLGFGSEYWYLRPERYEGWEQLRDQKKSGGRPATKREIALVMTYNLLDDVVVAAGGVERAIAKLRGAHAELAHYVSEQNIT